MIPGKKIQDELPSLKKMVEKSNNYFRDNYKRFNEFRKFVYETTISDRERDVNNELSRPNIEANVVSAYNSRLCGEFSKQEPSIEVAMDEGEKASTDIIPVVEGHFRHIMEEAKSANTQYSTYRDSLSGGFCIAEVSTEYAKPKSFDQIIKYRKSKYPTMAGFDPLATEPHKGDGSYSFQCFPKTKQDFEAEYDIDVSDINFPACAAIEGFSWSFNNTVDDILLICRLFKKKKKKVKIHELADEQVMTDDEYKDFIAEWEKSGNIAPPPIIAQTRMSETVTIYRYVFIDTMVLECKETDFSELPQVFFDGDSIDLYDDSRGTIKQYTRPYAYNAEGAQRLKNLAMQCLAGYLEMMSQAKYIIKKEAIPQEKSYLDALTRVQQASTIVVNAFKDNNPDHAISDPIIPIRPQPAPPEISNAITMSDQIIQNELGSYDAALGINDNQLSSLAIVEGATQSNAAAMPFVVNYIQGLNQVAKIIVDLMPKYYKTTRTIPIITPEGKRKAVTINPKEGQEGVDFNFDSNILQVKVTAGVNFNVQKSKALNQIIAMCRAAPGFAKFMETKGLSVLLDNFDVRGVDILKKLAEEYEKEQAAMQQKQMAMQEHMMQNDPKILDAHSKAYSAQTDAQFKAEKLKLEQEELGMRRETAEAERDAALARAQAEEVRANADLRMSHMEMSHRHGKDTIDMAHKISESHKNREERANEKENASKETNERYAKEEG